MNANDPSGPPRPLELHFSLAVQLETPQQVWHATLVRMGVRLEFQSPLELARYLATLREPSLGNRANLR